MTAAAKYVTDEAVKSIADSYGISYHDHHYARAALEAAAPHIVAAAEPDIRAKVERERAVDAIAIEVATPHIVAAVVAEAAEGRGPAAAPLLWWASKQVSTVQAAHELGILADQAGAEVPDLDPADPFDAKLLARIKRVQAEATEEQP
jgi:hypothetical protein